MVLTYAEDNYVGDPKLNKPEAWFALSVLRIH